MISIYPLITKMTHDSPVNVMPVSCYLVCHEDIKVMIDSGLSSTLHVPSQLEQLNISPDEIDLVINTHAHPDHMGHNRLFKNAKIIISREDYENTVAFAHSIADPKANLEEIAQKTSSPFNYLSFHFYIIICFLCFLTFLFLN